MTTPIVIATEAIAAEFPNWQVSLLPGLTGQREAFWQSADGRERRAIVAPTAAELLALLRDRVADKDR